MMMQEEKNARDDLIAKIKSKEDKVRADACRKAGQVGASAVKPLAAINISGDVEREVARSAKRAMWQIVRYAGRPKAEDERNAVVTELQGLLADAWPDALRRDVVWMLAEIGGDDCIPALVQVLKNSELLEDVRCALMQIPGRFPYKRSAMP